MFSSTTPLISRAPSRSREAAPAPVSAQCRRVVLAGRLKTLRTSDSQTRNVAVRGQALVMTLEAETVAT
jgi:hypothetical protein